MLSTAGIASAFGMMLSVPRWVRLMTRPLRSGLMSSPMLTMWMVVRGASSSCLMAWSSFRLSSRFLRV